MNFDPETTCRACLMQTKKLYGIFAELYMGLSLGDILCKIINPSELEVKEESGISSYFCGPCKTLLLRFYQWECKLKENQLLLIKVKKETEQDNGSVVNRILKENEVKNNNSNTEDSEFDTIKNESTEDINNIFVNELCEVKLDPVEEKTTSIETKDEGSNSKTCQLEYLDPDPDPDADYLSACSSENQDDKLFDLDFEPSTKKTTNSKKRRPQKFTCRICQEFFLQRKLLNLHMKEQHPDVKRKVPHFRSKRVVIRLCKICNVEFDDKPSYQRHMRNHRPFLCDQCGKSFGSKNHLVDHKELHLTFKRYVCSDCGKSFRLRSSFKTHRKIHTMPGSYVCDTCGRAFNSNSSMKTHVSLIHLKDKKYTCFICDQTFPLKGTLSKHIRRHDREREKTFICTECPMAYWENSSLKRHMYMKHSDKCTKFPCDFCGKEYTTKSILKRHIVVRHGRDLNDSSQSEFKSVKVEVEKV